MEKLKKRVSKGHFNSVPQKTLQIYDFGRPWDLQNRAETQARTSFSLIRLITKNCSTWNRKASILEALETPKSQKVWKNEPREIHEKTYSGKHRQNAKKPKWALGIDRKSIKNRRLGRCLPAGLQNVDFGGPGWIFRFSGVPPRAKIDKKRRKNCLTKRLKKTLCHAEFLSHVILSRSQCHTAAAEGAKLSTILTRPGHYVSSLGSGMLFRLYLMLCWWYLVRSCA